MAKNAVSPKAARLLRKVAAHILEEPKRYDQNEVLWRWEPGELFSYSYTGTYKAPKCGTIGCLAGWVCVLSLGAEKAADYIRPIEFASQKLGLTSAQELSLFGTVTDWPVQFSERYMAAKTQRQVALLAKDRIEHFIKTGE